MARTISLVTPSYSRDFERCQLLCDSVDRYARGYDRHYIVVGDEDFTLFQPLSGTRREVVPASRLLPTLWPLVKWRGRQYWWAPGLVLPIYGWHLQQLRKMAMALSQESERVMYLDSDICFCKPYDLSSIAHSTKSPLFVAPGEIGSALPNHVVWLKTAHRVLGLREPTFPADDYIGHMIVWDRETVRVMLERIEAVCGVAWWRALARARHFSEYLVYGAAVTSDPALSQRHERTTASQCLSYWSSETLDEGHLRAFLGTLAPSQFAVAIQSHSGTPIASIRKAILTETAASP